MSIRHDFERLPNGKRRHIGTWVDGEQIDPSRLVIDLDRYRVTILEEAPSVDAARERHAEQGQQGLFGGGK